MNMKRLLAVLLALTVCFGLMPSMAFEAKAADAYTLSGIPENVDISVNGVVQVPADGALLVEAGATVSVAPAKEYEIMDLEVWELEAIGEMVFVTLNADDVWSDGSGYQMLLDEDATAFGDIIPETGPLTQAGDASADVYDAFEYKIPKEADGSLNTTNILIGESETLEIPAGTYDWVITNPTPGDRMWIASSNGTVGGRADDFVFEAGHSYEFHVYASGQNDATDLTDTVGIAGDYVSVTAEEDGSFSFKMPESDAAMSVALKSLKEIFFYDFEEEEQYDHLLWYDADGDGYNWTIYEGASEVSHSGDHVIGSASYISGVGALEPDNWIFLDAVTMPKNATFSFWLTGQSTSYPETMEVYIGTQDQLDPSKVVTAELSGNRRFSMDSVKKDLEPAKRNDNAMKGGALRGLEDHMTQVGDSVYTTGTAWEWVEYTIDLSDYAGQKEYIALRHYGTYDQWALYLDDLLIDGDFEEPSGELEPVAEDLADGTIKLTWEAVEGAVGYNIFALENGERVSLGSGSDLFFVDTRNHVMGDTYSFLVEAWPDLGDMLCDGSVDDMFNPFVDVEDDRPTFEAIAWAYNNEIVKGSLGDDGFRYFDPEGSTTRMNFVMILYKMHGSPKVSGKNPFKDVTGKKSIAAVLWAYKKGLVKGTDKKHFSPDMNLSRMNIIMILYKLAGSPKVSGDNPFEDVSGSKSIKAVLWAVQNGFITGVDDTHFAPDGDCSRELFVDVLYKFNDVYKILK